MSVNLVRYGTSFRVYNREHVCGFEPNLEVEDESCRFHFFYGELADGYDSPEEAKEFGADVWNLVEVTP